MNDQATILVVDDEPVIRESIGDILRLVGYRILSAADGYAALQIIENEVPDLVISDIMMPRMNGYTLYNRIRRNPEWNQIPFIFLTAKGEREDIRYGKEIGADDYLTKPIDPDDLDAAVEGKLIRFSQLGVRKKASSGKMPSGSYEMGEIQIDFSNVPNHLSGKWFNATTGEYGDVFSTSGGETRSFTSCFGSAPSLIVLEVVK